MSLEDEGFAVRVVKPEDLGFIFDSWRKSGYQKFLKGEYIPFPQYSSTIKTALKHKNIKLLTRIYQSTIGKVMNDNWQNIIIVCDKEMPAIIYAWKCQEFSYCKQAFRDTGIGDFLGRKT